MTNENRCGSVGRWPKNFLILCEWNFEISPRETRSPGYVYRSPKSNGRKHEIHISSIMLAPITFVSGSINIWRCKRRRPRSYLQYKAIRVDSRPEFNENQSSGSSIDVLNHLEFTFFVFVDRVYVTERDEELGQKLRARSTTSLTLRQFRRMHAQCSGNKFTTRRCNVS